MARRPEQWDGISPPFTLGHEIAGYVEALGSGVTGLRVGETVAVMPLWGSDGSCPACRRGEENLCAAYGQMMGAGVGFDGGLTEFFVTPARCVVPIGDLAPVVAAPLTDAGLTTYTAMKPMLGRLRPGTTTAIIGIGGLGILAVQFLRVLTGAKVIAIDSGEPRRVLASASGADVVLPSDEHLATRLRDHTSGHGVDFVLDCVGTDSTLETGISSLSRGGRYTVVGGAGGHRRFGLSNQPWGAELTTSLSGGSVNLAEVIELARLGRIHVPVDRFALSRVSDAYAALEAGTLVGRAVCLPGT